MVFITVFRWWCPVSGATERTWPHRFCLQFLAGNHDRMLIDMMLRFGT